MKNVPLRFAHSDRKLSLVSMEKLSLPPMRIVAARAQDDARLVDGLLHGSAHAVALGPDVQLLCDAIGLEPL